MFRILLGLTTLGAVLTGIGWTLSDSCGPDGYYPAPVNDEWIGYQGKLCLLRGPINLPVLGDWLPEGLARDYPWLNKRLSPEAARAWAQWGEKPSSAYLLFGLLAASLVCLTLGFATRIAALAALLLASTFHHRLPSLMNGGDDLFRNGLYFLVLSPAGAVWSLDRFFWRKIRGRTDSAPVMIAPWSVRLMQIQICFMYFFTGVAKLGDGFDPRLIASEGWGPFFAAWVQNDWLDGQALYWVLNDVAVMRWPYSRLAVPMLLCRLASWGTIAFEIGFSFLICIRPLRKWILIGGLLLHLGILATMEIGWFSQVTLCWYVLWVPGERISALFHGLRNRLTRVRAESPEPVPVSV
jgi:hypothetical protein